MLVDRMRPLLSDAEHSARVLLSQPLSDQAENAANEVPMDVQDGHGNNLVVVGYWDGGSLTFNDGTVMTNGLSTRDSFVTLIDRTTGAVQWTKHETLEFCVRTGCGALRPPESR